MKSYNNFEELVREGIILSRDAFSEDDRERIENLTHDEVQALISIRAKLGDEFLTTKAGPSPSICIVF